MKCDDRCFCLWPALTSKSYFIFLSANQVQNVIFLWQAFLYFLTRLHVFHICSWFHIFPRLSLVTFFPSLFIGYLLSRAWHRLHFSRACFGCSRSPTDACTFSHACLRWDVSSTCHRLSLASFFPTPFTSSLFSCACDRLNLLASSSVWLNELFATEVLKFFNTFFPSRLALLNDKSTHFYTIFLLS